MNLLCCVFGSYLLGSLNPAHFLSWLKGFDIRDRGTRNAGATNSMFTLGFGYGVLVLLFDLSKAFASVQIVSMLFPRYAYLPILSGLACTLGHIFPFYLHFRGGKGVACLAGVVLGLTPKLLIPMALGALVLGLIFDRGSILPQIAAGIYPLLYYAATRYIPGTLLLCPLGLTIILAHRGNQARYKAGKESSFRKVVLGHDLDACVERAMDAPDPQTTSDH